MKLNLSFYVFSMLLISSSCQQEDATTTVTGKATFTISIRSVNTGRSKATVPAFVLFTVQDDTGQTQDDIKLSLFPFGENYVSENVELNTGSYKLTKFLILDSDNSAIYATPLEDSELAEYVTDPLPLDFSIHENTGTEISPQVLDVAENDDPSSFGYVSFGFEITSTIRNVTFDGIGVQDSLTLNYTNGRITAVDWCIQLVSDLACTAGYVETRYFEHGKMDSVSGRWNASYSYDGDLLKEIVAQKVDSTGKSLYFNTTTFLEYDGLYPVRIKVDFASGEEKNITLTYNASGNVTHKVIKNAQEVVVEDVQIQYSTTLNPLRRKIESPPFAVVFFGYDELAFYYSRHVPETLSISYANSPIVPKEQVIHYEITENKAGYLISAKAFRNDINLHNITVDYEK